MLGVIKRPFFIRGKEAEKYNLFFFVLFFGKTIGKIFKKYFMLF